MSSRRRNIGCSRRSPRARGGRSALPALGRELGPKGRRLMYVEMLPQRKLMLRFNNEGVPRWENRATACPALFVRFPSASSGSIRGRGRGRGGGLARARLRGGTARRQAAPSLRRPFRRGRYDLCGAVRRGGRPARIRRPAPPARRPASDTASFVGGCARTPPGGTRSTCLWNTAASPSSDLGA